MARWKIQLPRLKGTHQKRDSEELGGRDVFKLHLGASVWKDVALDKSLAVCWICKGQIKYNANTTDLSNHLLRCLGITNDTKRPGPSCRISSVLTTTFSQKWGRSWKSWISMKWFKHLSQDTRYRTQNALLRTMHSSVVQECAEWSDAVVLPSWMSGDTDGWLDVMLRPRVCDNNLSSHWCGMEYKEICVANRSFGQSAYWWKCRCATEWNLQKGKSFSPQPKKTCWIYDNTNWSKA